MAETKTYTCDVCNELITGTRYKVLVQKFEEDQPRKDKRVDICPTCALALNVGNLFPAPEPAPDPPE